MHLTPLQRANETVPKPHFERRCLRLTTRWPACITSTAATVMCSSSCLRALGRFATRMPERYDKELIPRDPVIHVVLHARQIKATDIGVMR